MKKLSGHANITLEQIISAYQDDLRGLVAVRIPTHLRSVVSFEDVLQAVWIEIDRCLPAFEFETKRQLGAWIKAIARSRLCDELRNAQAYGRGDVRVVGQGRTSATGAIGARCAAQRSPSSAVAGQEASLELLKALQVLSRRDQQIMRLHFLESLTTRQTARAMGLSLTTVNSSIYRSKREIAELMGGAGKYFNDP
ncbi:MAG: sigma-70 family RNA polymerase sigma factor [Planctomycetes bacterium]|nr:sigma-70 family RNA polymerase sigma factor [Planctomycetota bacterium]